MRLMLAGMCTSDAGFEYLADHGERPPVGEPSLGACRAPVSGWGPMPTLALAEVAIYGAQAAE